MRSQRMLSMHLKTRLLREKMPVYVSYIVIFGRNLGSRRKLRSPAVRFCVSVTLCTTREMHIDFDYCVATFSLLRPFNLTSPLWFPGQIGLTARAPEHTMQCSQPPSIVVSVFD